MENRGVSGDLLPKLKISRFREQVSRNTVKSVGSGCAGLGSKQMGEKLTRREFIQKAGIVGVTTVGLGLGGMDLLGGLLPEQVEAAGGPVLSIASGSNPEAMVKRAIDGLGGISKFVKRGNSVCIKPNIAWARTPAQAANTNPEVLAAVIKLCKQAGASKITVVDHTCDPSSVAFSMSGAKKVCSDLGVRINAGESHGNYRRINIPHGKILKSDECMNDILEADVFINIPIAKQHGSGIVTGSMKNLMGITWDRGQWHKTDLHQCIADYASAVRPKLVILDAVRVLLTNGPKGPGKTKDVGQVVASTDFVAIDAYAATLIGKSPSEVGHIVHAFALNLGQMNLAKVAMKRV